MPWGLTRFHHSGQSHFVTFCCYNRPIRLLRCAQSVAQGRLLLLTTDESRRIFESALERVRRSYRLYVYGYVVMPEHVHLLLSEPQRDAFRNKTGPRLEMLVSTTSAGDAPSLGFLQEPALSLPKGLAAMLPAPVDLLPRAAG